jgi:Amt family ammonium transporter
MRSPYVLVILGLLASIDLLAQCENSQTPAQAATCLQNLLKTKADQKYLDDNFTKKTDVTTTLKGYATKTDVENTLRGYAKDKDKPSDKEINQGYVQKSYLTAILEKYVSLSTLEPYAKSATGDSFWILLAVFLVLLMQAGFVFLELGVIQRQFDKLQAAYKISALFMTYAGYIPIGFAVMFGASTHNWGPLGFPDTIIAAANAAMEPLRSDGVVRSIGYFMFQAAFAATAVTIPSGSIAERMSVKGFAFASLVMATVIYPVFGHWAWGGGIYSNKALDSFVIIDGKIPERLLAGVISVGWLQRNGFHDFAGSTVVHSVGGWMALVGALALGPRRGRFGENPVTFIGRSMGMATTGALFLFFGWFGFNGGSKLAYSTDVDRVVFATVVAAFAAGITAAAFALCWELRGSGGKAYWMEKVLGGFLGGLVAITASCDLAGQWWQATLVGLAAGLFHNIVFDLLLRLEIDDPVGAIPVHLGCGVLGTIGVAFFTQQWSAQIAGIVAACAWTVTTSSLVFGLLLIPRLWRSEWIFLSDFEKKHLIRPPSAGG